MRKLTEGLSIKAVGISLGALLTISYVLCTIGCILLPKYAMHSVWAPLLPGFTWLSATSFILGLIESFIYGVYIAVVFVPIYNYLSKKIGSV